MSISFYIPHFTVKICSRKLPFKGHVIKAVFILNHKWIKVIIFYMFAKFESVFKQIVAKLWLFPDFMQIRLQNMP